MTPFDSLREAVCDVAGRSGCYVDVFVQSAAGHGMSFDDRRIEQTSSFGAGGVSVRFIRGEHAALSSVPGTRAEGAWAALRGVAKRLGIELPPSGACGPLFPEESIVLPDAPSWDFAREVDEHVRALSPCVRNCAQSFRMSAQRVAIVRGDGVVAADERRYVTFGVHVVAEKEGVLETGYEVSAKAVALPLFLGEFRPLDLATVACERALRMLDAPPCPAGTMPVVLSGEAGGTMVHESCGHGLEADIVQKDFSVYRDRLGEVVANSCVTLVDDSTLQGAYGSYAVDDEGTPAQRTLLIENGILQAYLSDVQSARRGAIPLTGNGRRESYRHLPVPRMSNTFLLPGEASPEEIVSRVRKGLFVKRLGGGEVDPTSGDFVFHVTEGYLIEKGRILRPVRGAILTGNGPDVLRNIEAVGNDLHLEPGTCGKAGQGVPVSDGQPTVLLREIVVGGRDTDDGDSA